MRVFTYLRRRSRVPFWELVAPNDGTTAMNNERVGIVWSFFRPRDPDARMAAVQGEWIEVVRTPVGWRFEVSWQWRV